MKTVVIYHRADFDGIFCREIAKKFLPNAVLIGWDYGDPTPKLYPDEGQVDPIQLYMLDISVEELMGHPNLVWIDHHKTAIEKYDSTGLHDRITGYRIDGVAACRLAWQWFLQLETNKKSNVGLTGLPDKKLFVDRIVSEPLAVRLAGEYDIWDKRDPDAELFQHGLRTGDINDELWSDLLNPDNCGTAVRFLLSRGRILQYARTRENESVINEIGFTFEWEGLTFLGCNASRYNSHLFTAGLRPHHHACFGFKWTGKDWSVSLYGVPGKPDVDLATIAVKYGGGGHKQACGFRCSTLPFFK